MDDDTFFDIELRVLSRCLWVVADIEDEMREFGSTNEKLSELAMERKLLEMSWKSTQEAFNKELQAWENRNVIKLQR